MLKSRIFTGNFFDIGEQQGKLIKSKLNLDNIPIDQKIFNKQLAIYKKYYPQFLEEIDGIAKGSGINKDKLLYFFLCDELLWYSGRFKLERACTIFGVKNKNGVFIGRNYDWFPNAEKVFEIFKVINPKTNSYIAVTDMGISPDNSNLFYTVDDAINDKGLFIGLTFAYSPHVNYGLTNIHITKLIAETCSTVEEAIAVFKKVPVCCPKNFFIADKTGKMAVVEHTSKKFKVFYPENDVLIQTNHYLGELAKEDIILKERPGHNTFLRYYETLQKINTNKETFTTQDIIEILGKKGSHVCQDHPNMKTIWSLELDMKRRRYYLYTDLIRKRKKVEMKI